MKLHFEFCIFPRPSSTETHRKSLRVTERFLTWLIHKFPFQAKTSILSCPSSRASITGTKLLICNGFPLPTFARTSFAGMTTFMVFEFFYLLSSIFNLPASSIQHPASSIQHPIPSRRHRRSFYDKCRRSVLVVELGGDPVGGAESVGDADFVD